MRLEREVRDDAHLRVLIVEDDMRMAGLLHRCLREEGMLADVAATGEDARGAAAMAPGSALAIVEAVARAHGGAARAAGADIWLSLPP